MDLFPISEEKIQKFNKIKYFEIELRFLKE